MKALRLSGWFRKPRQTAPIQAASSKLTRTIPAVPVSAHWRKLPYIKSHADYYRKLDTEPSFAAEMSESQRRIGNY